MYLLKKVNTNSSYTFSKILESGYDIKEQPNTISKIQFVNGKRKRVYTNYEDCIIKVNLGGLDSSDISDYLSNLVDGQYEYWSVEHGAYRNANFLVTKPSLTIDKAFATTNIFMNDISITLEKSSDIPVVETPSNEVEE